LGELASYDLRDVLDLCHQVLLSPHIEAHNLLAAQALDNYRIDACRVLRALIAPHHHQFVAGQPRGRVVNILGFWHEDDWVPLLPARILAVLEARDE
jgi:hypothetical protein